MRYQFPRIEVKPTVPNLAMEIEKLSDELDEVVEAYASGDMRATAEEVVDLYHACETALRIIEAVACVDITQVCYKVIQKNTRRGYYEKGE